MRKCILPLVFLLLAAACSDDGIGIRTLTGSDSGSEVMIDTGDVIDIMLESNPSTGYRWVVDPDSIPANLVLESDRYVEPGGGLVGAAGTQVFTFVATDSGAGIIRLEYIRPFDDLPVPDRVTEYIVRVDDAAWPPAPIGPPPGTSTATAPPAVPEAVTTTAAPGTTVSPTTTTTLPVWRVGEIDAAVGPLIEVAANVVSGLGDDDPDLFLSQFGPSARVTDPIVPSLKPSVADFHRAFRKLCSWGLVEVFVNATGSLTNGTCAGFYESVEGAPESSPVVRHLPMSEGLATGLMHRLGVGVTSAFPEETVTIIGFPASRAADVVEQVATAEAFWLQWEAAWATGDAAAIAALYAPDGIREDGFAGLLSTPQGTLDWFAALFRTHDGLSLTIEDLYASGLGPAAVYEITMASGDGMCRMRLASVWNLDEGGLIDHEYVYYDPETIHACGWWE